MKKRVLIGIVFLLAISTILPLSACGQQTTSTTTTTSSPGTTSKPTVSATTPTTMTSSAPTTTTTKPTTSSSTPAVTSSPSATTPATSSNFKIELQFPVGVSPVSGMYNTMVIPWTQEITKRTGGRVTFKIYPSETLVKTSEAYDAVIKGIADLSYSAHASVPGRFPAFEVMALPYLIPSETIGTKIVQEMYATFPEMRANMSDVHELSLFCAAPVTLHTAKKPVRTAQDMKGLKFGGQTTSAPLLTLLGAVPVIMGPGDFYNSMDKGVIDGLSIGWGPLNSFGCVEISKFHTNANILGSPQWMAMNLNTWNKLPPDIQQVFNDTPADSYWLNAVKLENDRGINKAKELGEEIIDLSPDEMSKWIELGRPLWDKWVADRASILPSQAMLDKAVELLKKYTS